MDFKGYWVDKQKNGNLFSFEKIEQKRIKGDF